MSLLPLISTQQIRDQQSGAAGGRGLHDRVPERSDAPQEDAGPRLAEEVLPDDRQKVRILLVLPLPSHQPSSHISSTASLQPFQPPFLPRSPRPLILSSVTAFRLTLGSLPRLFPLPSPAPSQRRGSRSAQAEQRCRSLQLRGHGQGRAVAGGTRVGPVTLASARTRCTGGGERCLQSDDLSHGFSTGCVKTSKH